MFGFMKKKKEQERKERLAIENSKRLVSLVALSRKISNELCYTDKGFYFHNDYKKSIIDPQAPDSWNIAESERMQIVSLQNELSSYANDMISKYWPKVLTEPTEFEDPILPPFVIFPMFTKSTIYWRIGIGESYRALFQCYVAQLGKDELYNYIKAWPAPGHNPNFYNIYLPEQNEANNEAAT